jgi:hypothetical protein
VEHVLPIYEKETDTVFPHELLKLYRQWADSPEDDEIQTMISTYYISCLESDIMQKSSSACMVLNALGCMLPSVYRENTRYYGESLSFCLSAVNRDTHKNKVGSVHDWYNNDGVRLTEAAEMKWQSDCIRKYFPTLPVNVCS